MMPTDTAATLSVSTVSGCPTWPRAAPQAMASASATHAPVMAAVRVPPSAWSTSQSSTIVFSPSAP